MKTLGERMKVVIFDCPSLRGDFFKCQKRPQKLSQKTTIFKKTVI